ncbi:MAG: 4-amino-4-deoxychorismate lyase [Armatimonadota bacterium]|nr:MAG: 4-amino-4-deoxychorismate lyase [Armatimonadota bacterium]
MTSWAWCNGQLCAENELRLPVRDEAVLYGASLFESLRCYNGHPFRLEQHLQRLRRWMERLSLFARTRQMVAISTPAVRHAIANLLEANGLLEEDARLRITVTAGSEQVAPSCFILAERINPEQIAKWRTGVAAVLLPEPHGGAGEYPKWGSFAWHIEHLLRAKAHGADEAIWFNRNGCVTESTVSNIFVWDHNQLLTPPVEDGILAGITRQIVIEIAQSLGFQCHEEHIPASLLPSAQGVFLTNSVREIVPVIRLNDEPLEVPPIVTTLQEAYRSLVQQAVAA